MGHHHLHAYLVQTVAFGFAVLVPFGVFALIGGAAWEAHRRKHGRTSKAGSPRALVSARFAPTAE
jgi:hypothetical protein